MYTVLAWPFFCLLGDPRACSFLFPPVCPFVLCPSVCPSVLPVVRPLVRPSVRPSVRSRARLFARPLRLSPASFARRSLAWGFGPVVAWGSRLGRAFNLLGTACRYC